METSEESSIELKREFCPYFRNMEYADVVIVGAGAAGCFGAIQAAIHFPHATIVVLERAANPLSKLKISGGGRCNVTNVLSEPAELSKSYPRGERFLKKAFYSFSSSHMKNWLEQRGVSLKLYPDGCYFPESNDSQTIINCFLQEMKKHKVDLRLNQRVEHVVPTEAGWKVTTPGLELNCKAVLYTVGGQPKISGFQNLSALELKIVSPVPSLFTFNMPDEPIRELMGIVTENATVKIAGEKWSSSGPLLITHWGMSGPAVLKCSAFGARVLEQKGYEATVLVNWTGNRNAQQVLELIDAQKQSQKQIVNRSLYDLKSRLWEFLLQKAGILPQARWSELGPKQANRLAEILVNDPYRMKGKTTFKEEFVTAGGIDLSEVAVDRMESKRFPGLFFAGEAMDIDGITGGFNFQAAWTTSFIAGKNCLT